MVAIQSMVTMIALYVHHYTSCCLVNTQCINKKQVKNKGKLWLHWSVKVILLTGIKCLLGKICVCQS